jgi:cystathionine beta-lyase
MGKDINQTNTMTKLSQLGRNENEQFGFVNPPIIRGSTVLYKTAEDLQNDTGKFSYGRQGTPTMEALESALNELEGAEGTCIVPSGLAAITLALQCFLKSGDHLLLSDSVYFPTRRYCAEVLSRFGIDCSYYPPTIGSGITAYLRPNTRAIFMEAPGSQTFEMQDVPAIVEVAKAHNIVTLIDNTWATPLFFKPIDYGVDLSIHACTKYVVGHSDAMLGSVAASTRLWPYLKKTFVHLGNCAGTEELFLGLRGLRTMGLRLKQHEAAGIEMANWFAARPEIKRVLHPALPSDAGHAIWKRDFKGASGLFGVILKQPQSDKVNAMLNALKHFGMGYSWGGYESLVITANPKGYRTAEPWTETGALLRFHIGLEDVNDLKEDLEQAFKLLK